IALVYESLCTSHSIGGAATEGLMGRPQFAVWSWLSTIGAGVSAGAAMNTKYNGFLVVVIPFIALLLGGWLRWRERPIRWNLVLLRLVLVVVIAGLLYLPWFLHVHRTYGYGSLLSHHSGYSTGIRQWPQNLLTMLASQRLLD